VGSFSYDANGRLAREVSASGAVDYEYDAAGQLVSRATADAAVTRYEYDAAGRRVRESGPDLELRYDWDDLGRLTEVNHSGTDGADERTISVVVDALGELAALDGTPMLWDTAHPLSPLTWNGQGAVVGEGSPWALASTGAAVQWLAPDWQGTIGDAARDPWGGAAGALAAGYRGEVEFAGETWLRNRVYHPASRAFQQRDPFPPQLGAVSSVNPYHYAANNPIGLSDPLGLHPVSDEDLKHIRSRMDRNLLDKGTDYVVKHAGDISAITGAGALIFAGVPGLNVGLLGIAAVTGGIAARESFKDGDFVGAGLDMAGVVGAVAAPVRAVQATRAARAATSATTASVEARTIGQWADRAGLRRFADQRYIEQADLGAIAVQHSRRAHAFDLQKGMLDRGGVGLGGVGVARSHARDELGYRDPDPRERLRVPSFGLR
jgi:RHS repeat-associated protein